MKYWGNNSSNGLPRNPCTGDSTRTHFRICTSRAGSEEHLLPHCNVLVQIQRSISMLLSIFFFLVAPHLFASPLSLSHNSCSEDFWWICLLFYLPRILTVRKTTDPTEKLRSKVIGLDARKIFHALAMLSIIFACNILLPGKGNATETSYDSKLTNSLRYKSYDPNITWKTSQPDTPGRRRPPSGLSPMRKGVCATHSYDGNLTYLVSNELFLSWHMLAAYDSHLRIDTHARSHHSLQCTQDISV